MKIIVEKEDLQDAIANLQEATIARCKAQAYLEKQAERETDANNRLQWLMEKSPSPTVGE